MTNNSIVNATAEMMTDAELAAIAGGFKSDPNYVSSNVIDARGGQITGLMGWTITFDVNGNISSVSKG
jgi:hypothetical protein